MRSQRCLRIPPLRASCQRQSLPKTVPFLTTTHRTSLSRIVCRMEVGRLPEEIYASTLPSRRAALRRQCLTVVEQETEIIAQWQAPVRTPWLDTYFLHTSMLGTTFFFVFLPASFFLGHDDLGRGTWYALLGPMLRQSCDLVSSCVQWLFALQLTLCSLAVRDHHLEYGLPSTHPTNSTFMGLLLGAHIYDHYRLGSLSTAAFATFLPWFILGIINWLLQHLSDWSAPLVVTVLLVNQHPSPVDDCPFLEDAIAFASVILGIITPSLCSKRLVTGVPIIFSWYILAKPSVQTLLPPLFLTCACPHRRHYMPAMEYVHGPSPTLLGRGRGCRLRERAAVKRRGSRSGSVQEKAVTFEEVSEGGTGVDGEVKHYDTDVLTKVVVYVGIGAIVTVMVPALFEALELGV
ncbi:hypothetical protein EDB92DRAFT_1857080 [Lactarius akahatsu]|uniref:Uncharacterized protein n=1 Tax=Lactarius akahatsu TaxID=416441 RepID=A0AAD4QE59_9AGAM|nr:hypothetical protein EDB92DRAFT_1857080 [Lactarius akahatsu]